MKYSIAITNRKDYSVRAICEADTWDILCCMWSDMFGIVMEEHMDIEIFERISEMHRAEEVTWVTDEGEETEMTYLVRIL